MSSKIMFSGGSWSKSSFFTISREQLISATSSITNLFQFTKNIDLEYTQVDQVLDDIKSQDDYSTIPNVDLKFIQSEILKAFDNNSSFYFHLYDEGDCAFISFTTNIIPYK